MTYVLQRAGFIRDSTELLPALCEYFVMNAHNLTSLVTIHYV